jgi:peptide chain release factor 3
MTDASATERGRIAREIERRRTFAIISHPDAGKTTLTEKLLLYGGVVQLAGSVRAKRGRSATVSDWMEMERERGISITTSVLQFPYRGLQMNLLDTPGHADFSEDTYRTLHAVDGAVVLLDCAKGVESQTRKLFAVCRERAIPIFTFVNKMDRPGRDPFDLVGEIEDVLGIGVFPITWPIFRSGTFCGVYHRSEKAAFLFEGKGAHIGERAAAAQRYELDDPRLAAAVEEQGMARLREDLDLLEAAGDAFDTERFIAGQLSPMFFGSAMNNFGLEPFLDTFSTMMPAPRSREAVGKSIAVDGEFSGFIFKIQANMNRAHRDRLAFLRIVSGSYKDGMRVRLARTGKEVRLTNGMQFVAQERQVVEEAFAGDVVGVYDSGVFQVGDTLSAQAGITFPAIPSFAPEHFASLIVVDSLRRKQLTAGIEQLAYEGTIQLYREPRSRAGEAILGAVGRLQLEVAQYRLENEYNVQVRLESLPYTIARWVLQPDGTPVEVDWLARQTTTPVVLDVRNRPVVLFSDQWQLRALMKRLDTLVFAETASGALEAQTLS